MLPKLKRPNLPMPLAFASPLEQLSSVNLVEYFEIKSWRASFRVLMRICVKMPILLPTESALTILARMNSRNSRVFMNNGFLGNGGPNEGTST